MDKSDADAPLSRRRFIKTQTPIAATAIVAPYLLRISRAFAAYPDRTVRIVVANTPGGPSDIIARIMAAALQEQLGGTVIVENKGGAGGNLGMGYVARSDPDGYTLLLSTSAYSVNPGLYQSLPYDPFKDFAAICELATTPNVFAVSRAAEKRLRLCSLTPCRSALVRSRQHTPTSNRAYSQGWR
jgi:tripartite-type tricarboxylate transporter receptor subunit TctC